MHNPIYGQRNDMTKQKIFNALMPILSLCTIVILWAITAKAVGMDILVPSISSTFQGLGKLLSSSEFYVSVGWTLLRSLVAFSIAFVCGMLLSIVASLSPYIKRFLSPIVVLLRVIPTMSIILLSIIWLTSAQTPILVAFVIIFPLIYGGYLSAIENVDGGLIEMAKIYKVPLSKRIFSLYIPQTATALMNVVQNTIGLTLKLVIAAEVLAQTKESIGLNMQLANLYLETPTLIAWTIVAVVLGGLLESIVLLIKKIYQRSKV